MDNIKKYGNINCSKKIILTAKDYSNLFPYTYQIKRYSIIERYQEKFHKFPDLDVLREYFWSFYDRELPLNDDLKELIRNTEFEDIHSINPKLLFAQKICTRNYIRWIDDEFFI